jgi:hypothetical protein
MREDRGGSRFKVLIFSIRQIFFVALEPGLEEDNVESLVHFPHRIDQAVSTASLFPAFSPGT